MPDNSLPQRRQGFTRRGLAATMAISMTLLVVATSIISRRASEVEASPRSSQQMVSSSAHLSEVQVSLPGGGTTCRTESAPLMGEDKPCVIAPPSMPAVRGPLEGSQLAGFGRQIGPSADRMTQGQSSDRMVGHLPSKYFIHSVVSDPSRADVSVGLAAQRSGISLSSDHDSIRFYQTWSGSVSLAYTAGTSISLTATASATVSSSGSYLEIFDTTTGTRISSCTTGMALTPVGGHGVMRLEVLPRSG